MSPIEFGPVGPVGRIEPGSLNARAVRIASGSSERSTSTAKADATYVKGEALDAGEAPVDVERVSQIRKAIEEGTYPILPAKVADAMIAAGILLRTGQ